MLAANHIWFFWSMIFLLVWVVLYLLYPRQRKEMWWSGVFTTPFGLTEPLFVPEYWDPPSLFGLAQKTGFDIESIIFSFAIGGVAAVLFNIIWKKRAKPMNTCEMRMPLHRHHYLALSSPFIAFAVLYYLPWNMIYSAIIAMFVGAIATMLCRPDLKKTTWMGGVIFFSYYVILLQAMSFSSPGYVEQVWNLDALTGVLILGMPLEELLFAIGFGMYWSGVYEHFTWRKLVQ